MKKLSVLYLLLLHTRTTCEDFGKTLLAPASFEVTTLGTIQLTTIRIHVATNDLRASAACVHHICNRLQWTSVLWKGKPSERESVNSTDSTKQRTIFFLSWVSAPSRNCRYCRQISCLCSFIRVSFATSLRCASLCPALPPWGPCNDFLKHLKLQRLIQKRLRRSKEI